MDNQKIFIAGHKGMVGSALVRFLKKKMLKLSLEINQNLIC